MKILVDEIPEKAWECLFCNAYDLNPQCLLPGAEGTVCLLNWTQGCPYLTTKENEDDD